LKYSNISEPRPPITSTNSGVSLKGDVSNPKFRGDVDKMNPKSMWIRRPSLLRRILPLCLTTRKLKLHPHMYKCFQKFSAFENIQHKSHKINIQNVFNKGEKE
jgi:hypothetical protein